MNKSLSMVSPSMDHRSFAFCLSILNKLLDDLFFGIIRFSRVLTLPRHSDELQAKHIDNVVATTYHPGGPLQPFLLMRKKS